MDRMGPEEELIAVTREESGLAIITINRPRSLNSLTLQMITRLAHEFKALGADEAIRVIILTGSGRAFCSGVDLTAAEEVFQRDVKDVETDPIIQMHRCRNPIIGAINGPAITAGFEIALACDVLIASKAATFIDTHSKFGIFPSWGLSQKLSRIIGPNRAREVSLTAKPIDAEQALEWGLVNYVVNDEELLKKARQVAEAMIAIDEDMVLMYKSVINDGFLLNMGDALLLEKERAQDYYRGMSKEKFQKMQEFIHGRSSKKRHSKL